ncbi:LacI family DNA-binding transcriptional regulator [Nocardioides zeae]|uniref:LacI family transcriptional regulator n=1 Tax=Nocardioides zeae TaxID=1457234 RepID=A0AAJ1U190_9ACTN|nr:LacI family DNA-binding transcriptional regulator [Nocardioides zeae]MDQ1106060.1 LacI family transcriptional regulator [Nocardioides zeae]
MAGRARIGDVAKLAGVSTATVSRVLTGNVPVSPQLRERVLDAAAQLDYSVNPAARALRSDRTSSVGIVVPDLTNPFFTALVDQVERGLRDLGLSLHVCSSAGDVAIERDRVRSLQRSQVEVLVVTPVDHEASGEVLREAAASVPLVMLDQVAADVDSDWVGTDESEGMRLVVDHLVEQGVRTAAYVGAQPLDSSSIKRYDAVREHAAGRGIELVGGDELLGQFSVEWGVEAARRLADRTLPEAVVCAADVIALGVLQELDARGVAVPEDALVTGYDDIPLSSHPRLSLTTVRQPLAEISARAVALVEDLRGGGDDRVPVHEALLPRLVVRSSSSRSTQ